MANPQARMSTGRSSDGLMVPMASSNRSFVQIGIEKKWYKKMEEILN